MELWKGQGESVNHSVEFLCCVCVGSSGPRQQDLMPVLLRLYHMMKDDRVLVLVLVVIFEAFLVIRGSLILLGSPDPTLPLTPTCPVYGFLSCGR